VLRFHDECHPLSRPLPLHLAKLAQEYVLPFAPAPAAPAALRVAARDSVPAAAQLAGAVERHPVVSGSRRKARVPASFALVDALQVDELDVGVASCGLSQIVGEACAAEAHEACLIGRGAASKRLYQLCG
jgi:hypothetical protein